MEHKLLRLLLKLTLSGLMVVFTTSCPHKYVPPQFTPETATPFSLPAPVTSGIIVFHPYLYRTSGSYQITQYGSYNGQKISYTVVGSQIQFYKATKADGSTTYMPRWVVSGANSAEDIRNKRNLIIISFLPVLFNSIFDNQICSNSADITSNLFCENFLCADDQCGGVGGIVGTAPRTFQKFNNIVPLNFHSYEAGKYTQCTDTPAPSCISGFPTDSGTPPNGSGFNMDIGGNTVKEKAYDSFNTKLKDFDVVVEFFDSNSNLYTTKFPYNRDLDNIGNHTPVHLTVGNFPDPKFPMPFTAATAKQDKTICTNSSCLVNIDPNTATENCTSLQQSLDCSQVAAATIATINSTNTSLDDDIIHKLQLAGKEFRAKGTNTDPRFEMTIIGISFAVERAVDKFVVPQN